MRCDSSVYTILFVLRFIDRNFEIEKGKKVFNINMYRKVIENI